MIASPFTALRKKLRERRSARTFPIVAVLTSAALAAAAPIVSAQPPGYGPGVMGGYGGYGMGPGMMGGYGPGNYGMGPGMMYGYGGGYGMGPGMMYGYGPGAYGGGPALNLTDEQRAKMGKIQQDLRSKQWALMGQIQDQYARRAEAPDDEVASQADDQIAALQQQMLTNATVARKQMDAVLTKEQRQQLRRGGF